MSKMSRIRGGFKAVPSAWARVKAAATNAARTAGTQLVLRAQEKLSDWWDQAKDSVFTGQVWDKNPGPGRPKGSKTKSKQSSDSSAAATAVGKITKTYYKSSRKHRHSKGFMQALASSQKEKMTIRLSNVFKTTKTNVQIVWDMQQVISDTGVAPTISEVNTGIGSVGTYPQIASIMSGQRNFATNTPLGMIQSIVAAFPAAATTTGQVFIDKITSKYTLTSASLTTITIDIYDCLLKHDNPGALSNVLAPSQYWQQGIGEQQYTVGQAQTGITYGKQRVTQVDATPYNSLLFRDYWHAEKKTITLTPGATHVHTSSYDYKLLLDFERYQFTDGLGGITRSIMFAARGVPVYDNVNTAVVTSGVEVLCLQEIYITANMMPFSSTQTILLDTTVQGLLASEKYVNTQSDVVVTGSDEL